MTRRICLAYGGDLSEPSGGTDRVSAFAAGLAARGADVTVVAPRPAGPLSDRFDDIEFVPVRVSTRGVIDQPLRAFLVARKSRRLANKRNARLQIEHATLAGIADILGTTDYVLDMHDLAHASPLYGDLPFGSSLQRIIQRIEGRAIHHADKVLVVSEAMAERVATVWNLPRERLRVVPNGYSPDSIAPHRNTDTVPGRVVFFGTLLPKVDIDALVAIARLQDVEKLFVIGDGERRLALERAARAVPNLEVTGRLPDREAFSILASAAVAVNPQHASGLQVASSPVKLYYYAALGLPMVLTEGPEAADWLANVGAAELVPAEGAFTERVGDLLTDEERRSKMSAAALEAGRDATWDRQVEQVAAVHSIESGVRAKS